MKTARLDCTYHTEHLLFQVEFLVNQLNDTVDPGKPLEQVNFSLEALDRVLIGILERDSFQGQHFAALGRHTVHLSGSSPSDAIDSRVRPVVDSQ